MKKPFFSVIIPTLNEEKFISKLLDSLVAQTERDFEVIVTDGKSKDSTVKIVTNYKKSLPKVTVIENEIANLPMQRNNGAQKATGKYLVLIDADTVLYPNFMERTRLFLEKEPSKIVSPWFSPDSQIAGDALLVLLINGTIEAGILTKRPVSYGSLVVIDHEMFDEVGGYDETRQWGEDNDITKRIYEHGHMVKVLRETLCIYSLRRFRRHGTLKTMQWYARAAFSVVLFKQTPTTIPGYIMGGHLYDKAQKQASESILNSFQKQLQKLVKEFFE